MTELRAKPGVNKTVLVRDLKRVREALQGDHSPGACLPIGTFDQLYDGTLKALSFLAKRKMGKYSK
jgi:hypothetical protein